MSGKPEPQSQTIPQICGIRAQVAQRSGSERIMNTQEIFPSEPVLRVKSRSKAKEAGGVGYFGLLPARYLLPP